MKREWIILGLLGAVFPLSVSAQFKLPELPKVTAYAQELMLKKPHSLPDSAYYYIWNINKWELHSRQELTYNASDEFDLVTERSPDNDRIDLTYQYSYASNGMLSMVYVEGNDGTQLIPYYREKFTYDGKGNRLSYRKELYSAITQTWTLDQGDSVSYVYGSGNQVTEYTIFSLSGNSVFPSQKLIWGAFGSDDLPQSLIVQQYQSGSFDNYIKLEQITWKAGFDLFDFNPSSYFGYQWNGNQQTWGPQVYDSAHVV